MGLQLSEQKIGGTAPGGVLSHANMCSIEGISLQRGMNYRPSGRTSIFLMSVRPNAPYRDEIREDGKVLVYEGHDEPRTSRTIDPKLVDQPLESKNGTPTQNGHFYRAAQEYAAGSREPELIRVYEKVRSGIWVFNGTFQLFSSWQESDGNRSVCKFMLRIIESDLPAGARGKELEHNRLIPSQVKLEVWKRDDGACIKCGSSDNLHFDHIIPYSKGGSSLVSTNIQLLCARHNLEKRDRIE